MKNSLKKKRNNLPQMTQQKFGQSVHPTQISQLQFNKLFGSTRTIGEGTFGTVRCVQNCYGQNFAIKESKDNEQTYGLFRQVAIMKKFNHPNILKSIAFYEIKQNQKLIILTQFCKYKSLRDFSSSLPSLSQRQKYRLSVQIFSGLYALHEKNIMHRDLKPENVLIDEKEHAKLCDFGFCRYDQSEDFSKSRKIGTPLYNSPETEKGVYTKKCDIYSYGLIVYFIFSNGKHLFKKTTTHQELKSQRKQHFREGDKSYKQQKFPLDIIELLENTITEKEQKRKDTSQIKIFWHKTLQQKNMTELIKRMQESQAINNYQRISPTTTTDQQQIETSSTLRLRLTNEQKLVSQLIKRNATNNNQLQAGTKILQISQTFKKICQLMKEFKQTIEEVQQLSRVEKQLIAYGFLYQLQLRLESVLSQFNRVCQKQKGDDYQYGQCLTQCMQSMFCQIMKKKKLLCSVLVKVGNYLQLIKHLFKPSQLLQPIRQSFDQLKCFQAFIKDVPEKDIVNNFKKAQDIENNRDLYQLIGLKYKPKVQPVNFCKDFVLLLTKYRNCLPKDNKQNQRQKIQSIFEKLSKI